MNRLRIFIVAMLCLSLSQSLEASDSTGAKRNAGIEQDLLPYFTGGYFAAAWAGKGHVRVRALLAHVHKPDFMIEDGFTNNEVNAYAVTGDYFLKTKWKGWWIAGGLVYWDSKIQSDAQLTTASFYNWLINGSIGYNITLYKHLYMSPWAGLNCIVGGDKEVIVDGKVFKPAVLNPEASIKFGIYF